MSIESDRRDARINALNLSWQHIATQLDQARLDGNLATAERYEITADTLSAEIRKLAGVKI